MRKNRMCRLFLLTVLMMLAMVMTASAKSKTVKMKADNGKYTYSGTYKGEKYVFHRFTVGQAGVIRVTGYELSKKNKRSGYTIALCDKNKKRIDVNKENYINFMKGKIKYYVLTKGTYYFRANAKDLKKGSRYMIQARFTKMGSVLGQTGTSMNSAVYINNGSSHFAMISANAEGDGGRYLYFYTDGKEPVLLTFIPQLRASNQGTFTAWIYGPSYKEPKQLTISKRGDRYKLSTTVITKKGSTETKKTTGLKKGYYYVKIYREQTTDANKLHANGYIKVTRSSETD